MTLKLWKPLRSWRTAGMTALVAALVSGCSLIQGNGDKEVDTAQQMKTVRVENIVKQTVEDPVDVPAEVVSSVQLTVTSKTGGEVVEILKQRGDSVKQGEVIVKLNSPDLAQHLDEARQALSAAQDNLSNVKIDGASSRTSLQSQLNAAQQTYNKLRNDYDLGLGTKEQVDQARTDLLNVQSELSILNRQQTNVLSAAQTAVNQAKAGLQEAEEALDDQGVKAPTSGLLTEIPIVTGMSVAAGAEIGLIEKLDTVKIKASLSADGVNRVKGKKQLTYFTPDRKNKYTGDVSFLSDVLDPETKGFELNLAVSNTDMSLKPGMKVIVRLTDDSDLQGLAVPVQSILQEGDAAYIFVVSGDRVMKRKVELGRTYDLVQEVLSGIQENEQVVVSSVRGLKDQEQVQVQTQSVPEPLETVETP